MGKTNKASSNKRRVNKAPLKKYIEEQYGSCRNASKEMGHSGDYLGSIFRKYNTNIPEAYLDEIKDKLNINMEQFLKKNTPKYDDSQIKLKTEADDFGFEERENENSNDDLENLKECIRELITISLRNEKNISEFANLIQMFFGMFSAFKGDIESKVNKLYETIHGK